tara:strand:- start:406 stop:768 length:363 start_codon:yes stop_codon:yes gene_type:complete
MATRAELLAEVQAKIDITGQKLTTGVRVRSVFDDLINSLFSQFGTVYTETVTVASNKDYVITVNASLYEGSIRSYAIFDSTGYEVGSRFTAKKGVDTGNQTLTINSAKGGSNIEVNIILQ